MGSAGSDNSELTGSRDPIDPPSNGELLRPEDVALRLKITPEQVRALIREHELNAVNVSVGSKRPRYRITSQAVEDFISSRSTHRPARRKRVRRLQPVQDHFPGLK